MNEGRDEARLRDRALAAAPSGILITDPTQPDNPIVYANPGFERMTGYASGEVMGRNCRFLQGEERDQPAVRELRAAIREARETRVVLRNYKKDGEPFWNELHLSPVRGEDGRPVNFVGVQQDVTERVEAEERLAYHAGLLENMRDAVIATDERFVIRAWNKGAEKMYGRTSDEALGQSIDRAVPAEMSEEEVTGAVRELAETGQFRAEVVTYREDGAPVFVEGLTITLRDERDRITGYLSINRDVTKRKRAEEEAATRARQQAAVAGLGRRALVDTDLRSLMDEAVSLVTRTLGIEYGKISELLPDDEGLLVRAGVGWGQGLVGRTIEEAGRGSLLGYTVASDEAVIVEDLSKETRFAPPVLLRDHRVVSGMSVTISGRDGPFGVLAAYTRSSRAFKQEDAAFLQAVANVLGEAFERKKAEDELREVREAERQRMARDLHDEVLQDLARTIEGLRVVCDKAERGQVSDELGRQIRSLERVTTGIRGAIYDLRLDSTRQDQAFPELLETLVELNRRDSPQRRIDLSVEGNFPPPLTAHKETELLRILREALSNVRRHSGATHVRVAVEARDGKLRAEVSDDGRGIGTETPGGTGIRGMRERARALGGSLKVEGSQGEGTRVRFEAPLDTKTKGIAASERGVRILLVEDHASLREAVAAVLEQEPGFVVVGQAGSLAEAREIVAAEPVDVAVVDLGLPDGYGGDLVEHLHKTNPRAKALVLSASVDREEVGRAVEAGATGVVHKSAGMLEVVNSVRRLSTGDALIEVGEAVELLRHLGTRRREEYEARIAIARLTPREKEVLQALAEGLDGGEIAERLHISKRTETNHMASIFDKLGVHSRLQALIFALRHGLASIG